MKIDDIDWTNWNPQQRATLLFVIKDGQILLIHKKRGLGAGKINGPGGRLEPGETPYDAAVRETQEEVGLTPTDAVQVGELHFQFVDGLSLFVTAFSATQFTGTLTETDEALPFWCDVDAIPYEKMWQDDIFWLPLLLKDQTFRGFFTFDESTMLDRRIDTCPAEDTLRES